MGGALLLLYVLVCNAICRPHYVSKLILLSPAGHHEFLGGLQRMTVHIAAFLCKSVSPQPFPPSRSSAHSVAMRLLQDLKRSGAMLDLLAALGSVFIGGSLLTFPFRFTSFEEYPMGGTSTDVLLHGTDIIKAKEWIAYQYRTKENRRRYGRDSVWGYWTDDDYRRALDAGRSKEDSSDEKETGRDEKQDACRMKTYSPSFPPASFTGLASALPLTIRYDFGLIDVPTVFFSGGKDQLIPEGNIEVQQDLINVSRPGIASRLSFPLAGHLDFTFATGDDVVSAFLQSSTIEVVEDLPDALSKKSVDEPSEDNFSVGKSLLRGVQLRNAAEKEAESLPTGPPTPPPTAEVRKEGSSLQIAKSRSIAETKSAAQGEGIETGDRVFGNVKVPEPTIKLSPQSEFTRALCFAKSATGYHDGHVVRMLPKKCLQGEGKVLSWGARMREIAKCPDASNKDKQERDVPCCERTALPVASLSRSNQKWKPIHDLALRYPWLAAFTKLDETWEGLDKEARELGLHLH